MSCLSISGVVNTSSGWGIHLARVAEWLTWCELFVRPVHYGGYGEPPLWLQTLSGYEIADCESELIIYSPSIPPTSGKRTCYFTMHETDHLPSQWVKNLNLASLLLVPSEWNMKEFRKCGVKTPMWQVPLGCPNTQARDMAMGGPTVFGCAGRPQNGSNRKGLNSVISAFVLAFPKEKNVRLKIKSFPDEKWDIPDDKRITVESRYFTDEEMTDWHASLTCFVSASKGEGWGLFQHHAMSVGRPVIGCLYGGVTQFMKPENSYACDFDLINAVYAGGGKWAQPRLEHMVDLMRYVHQSRDEAKRRGLAAHTETAPLSWDNSCQITEKALKNYRFI